MGYWPETDVARLLATDGDLLTRDGGELVPITRAELAADPAFANTFAAIGYGAWRVDDHETLAGSTASVTLTAPSDAVMLRITASGLRSTDTTDTDRVILLQLNGDTGTNYAWVRVGEVTNGSDTVAAGNAADDTGATSMQLTAIPTSQTNTNRTGATVISIDHHDESAWKSATAIGYGTKSTNDQQLVYTAYGKWKSTSRITSVTLAPSAGSFAAGAVFILEGMHLVPF